MSDIKQGKYLVTLIGDRGDIDQIFATVQAMVLGDVHIQVWNSETDDLRSGHGNARVPKPVKKTVLLPKMEAST